MLLKKQLLSSTLCWSIGALCFSSRSALAAITSPGVVQSHPTAYRSGGIGDDADLLAIAEKSRWG
jgi:hypothetical protein